MRSVISIALVALFLAAPLPVRAQDSEPMSALLEKVEYWKSRGREDKVAEMWRKVLAADPAHAQALTELCAYEAQSGNKSVAREYLRRLESAHPSHPDMPRLRRIVELSEDYRVLIEEARAYVRAGDTPRAIAKYREAFGNLSPPDHLAIEYYTTVGGTGDEGWEEARQGLQKLHERHPDDDHYKLAYAKHLTYRSKTRREGIGLLREMSGSSPLRNQARAAWQDAMMWLAPRSSNRAMFKQYLDEVGDDPDIRKRYDRSRRSGPGARPKSPAEVALDAGNLDEAERLFLKVLDEKPEDVDAMVGLAKVAMARGQFEEARDLLDRAKELAPRKKRRNWEELYTSVEFWVLLSEAETLRVQGRLTEAEATLRKAMALSEREAYHARAALASILLAQGELERARDLFGKVLEKDGDHEGALRGMIHVLIELGREGEAAEFSARLAKLEATGERDKALQQAEQLRWLAAIERSVGRLEDARSLLEQALIALGDPPDDPDDVEQIRVLVLHDLVHVELALGQVETARDHVNLLLSLAPEALEVQLVRAHVLAREGRLGEALEVVNAIPSDGAHVGLAAFQRELRVKVELKRLDDLAKRGMVGETHRGLSDMEQEVVDSSQLLALVALAWSDLGEHRRAIDVMHRALARSPQPSVSLRLQLGAILLRAERFTELGELLEDLDDSEELARSASLDHAELALAYAVRKADRAAAAGRFRQAYEYLYPVLERYPEDPRVLSSLGRLFLESGDHDDARAIFARLLEIDPTDHEAMEGAIRSAIGAGHRDQARDLVEAGLEAYPDSPRMHLTAARCYLMMGNDVMALHLLVRGRELAELGEEQADIPDLPADMADPDAPLEVDSSREEILRAAARRFARAGEPDLPPRSARTVRDEIEEEIRGLRARNSEQIGGGFMLRYRHGVPGLGQLVEFDVPVSVGIALGTAGRLQLTARAVVIDSGELDVTDPAIGDRFGQIGRVLVSDDNVPWNQARRGVALDLSYAYRGVFVQVGSTPLGFPQATLVGGLGWGGTFGGFSAAIRGGRRLVMDSLVSMGGAVDPVSLEAWGLVTANGGRVEIAFEQGPILYYGYGGFDWLHGKNVQTNRRGLGGAGLRWSFQEKSTWTYKTGLSLGVMGYARNQRHFTWGHGGYFSPQFFFNGAIPFVIDGESDRLSAHLEADVGINWFREDAVEYYPLDSWMQDVRAGRMDSEGEFVESVYPELRAVGLAVNFRGRLGYRISPQFVVGAEARAHYAADYQEYYGGIYLGYSFREDSTPSVPVIPCYF